MKKYLFLIILCSFVFLGLSNYSFGQFPSCGQAPNPTVASQSTIDAYNACIATQSSTTNGTTTTTQSTTNSSTSSPGGGQCPGSPGCPGYQQTMNSIPVSCSSLPSTGCNATAGCKWQDNTCKSCKADGVCCGISLNTSVPFIGNCIESDSANKSPNETGVTGEDAFPVLMGSLTKMLVTIILIISFVLIIIGGIMIATGNPSGGKKMIINVVVGIALLGASGVILRLINPNFFG